MEKMYSKHNVFDQYHILFIALLCFSLSFLPLSTNHYNHKLEKFFENVFFHALKNTNSKYLVIDCPQSSFSSTETISEKLSIIFQKLKPLNPICVIIDSDPLLSKDDFLYNNIVSNTYKYPIFFITPVEQHKSFVERMNHNLRPLANTSFIVNQNQNLEMQNIQNEPSRPSVSYLISQQLLTTPPQLNCKTKLYFKDSNIPDILYTNFISKKWMSNALKSKIILVKTGMPSLLTKPYLTNIGIMKATTLLFNDIETRLKGSYDKAFPEITQKILLLTHLLLFSRLKTLIALFFSLLFFNIQLFLFGLTYFHYNLQSDYFTILFVQILFLLVVIGMELFKISKIKDTLKDYQQLKKNTVLINQSILSMKKLSELGRLASGINHEIGNPLHNIYNSLKMIDTDKNLSSDSKETLLISLKEIKRLQSLNKKLKGFYKPIKEKKRKINVNKILNFSLTLLSSSLHAKNIKIQKEMRNDDIIIFADPDQLQQVFINLLLNAIDALNDTGLIYIKTWIDQNDAKIIIKDNGPGISESVRSEIFQAFFTTKGEKGSGLGLYVSFDIINNLQGTIVIQNDLKNITPGAEFIITIPLA